MTDKAPNTSILQILGKQDQQRRLREETGLPLDPDLEADQRTAEAIRKAADLSKPVKLENPNNNG